MEIKTKEFQSVVKMAMIGTSTKDLVAQMSHIVLHNDTVMAYNDKISIVAPFDTGVVCSLPAEDLNKILNGINDETLEVTIEDNIAKIISGSTEAELSTEVESRAVENYFSTVDYDGMEWKDMPKDFLNQLALSRFSVSSNVMDPHNLSCVYVKDKSIYSGDGHRLSVFTLSSKMEEVLIPGNVIPEILSFPELDKYAVVDGWIHFENPDGVVISCRTVLGEFPDFNPLFKNFVGSFTIQIDESLAPVLQNLGTLVAGDADFMKAVDIVIAKGTTTVTGTKEGLKIVKKISNNHKTDTVQFSISPTFLAHILTLTDTLHVAETSALFDGDTFTHLVQLPIR